MIIVWRDIRERINIECGDIWRIIVESPQLFTRLIGLLYHPIAEAENDFFVLDGEYSRLKVSDTIIAITDYINLSANDKVLQSRLKKKLLDAMSQDLEINGTLNSINELFNAAKEQVGDAVMCDLEMSANISIDALYKLMDVKFAEDDNTLLQKLITYVKIISEFNIAKIVTLVHITSYLNPCELEELITQARYEQIALIFLESRIDFGINYDKTLVIDTDLCEYYI